MDRNTIIAIVLSVIVITVGMTVQSFFMEEEMAAAELMAQETAVIEESASSEDIQVIETDMITAVGDEPDSTPFTVKSGEFEIEFNPAGAAIESIKLVNHFDNGSPVELIYKDPDDADIFTMYVGNAAVDDVFSYDVSEIDISSVHEGNDITRVSFIRDFQTAEGEEFTIEKSYAIPLNDEFLIQMSVRMYKADGSPVSIGDGNTAYTVSVGPQIGPAFQSLSSNYDWRRLEVKYAEDKDKKNLKFSDGHYAAEEAVDWMSLSGKYFAFVLMPEDDIVMSSVTADEATFDTGVPQKDIMYFSRANDGTLIDDIYSFYAGPKVSGYLDIYNRMGENIFGLNESSLNKVVDGNWLSWLEAILNWILQFFHRFIPNYGVAIILLTILVKLILQPLSKKGMDSTAKMGALTPKIEEIKQKFPDNPEAQNAAMAKLYRDEGINPMGSCLPMLIQFPIFIALYGLLNTNFDLRGSMFIPGWIPDLSIPDTICTLPFSIPLLGPDVHILPVLYVISMILSMKITQSSSTAASSQAGMMAFMTYGMPLIFFFVMYNAPSGLLLYWSTVNIISIGQQIFVNKKKKAVFAEEIAEHDAAKQAKKDAKRKSRRK